jgi:hypothetical protein
MRWLVGLNKSIAVTDLERRKFLEGADSISSVIGVAQTPTTDINGWAHARKFLNNAGSIDIAVDGSVTPVEFKITLAANEIYIVKRLEFVFTDNGNINQLSDFMSIAGGLTNGLQIEAILTNPQNPIIVKTNYELINRLRSSIEVKNLGNDSVAVGDAYFESPVVLYGSEGHTIKATVRDNMGSLLLSTISATGVIKEV